MGRKAKVNNPKVVTLRLPQDFVDQCPEDQPLADWIRFDLLGLTPDGEMNIENKPAILNGERKALQNIIAFYVHLIKSGKITAEELKLFSTIRDDFKKIGGLIKE